MVAWTLSIVLTQPTARSSHACFLSRSCEPWIEHASYLSNNAYYVLVRPPHFRTYELRAYLNQVAPKKPHLSSRSI